MTTSTQTIEKRNAFEESVYSMNAVVKLWEEIAFHDKYPVRDCIEAAKNIMHSGYSMISQKRAIDVLKSIVKNEVPLVTTTDRVEAAEILLSCKNSIYESVKKEVTSVLTDIVSNDKIPPEDRLNASMKVYGTYRRQSDEK